MKKRIVSVLLCVALMLGAVPVLGIPAQAASYKLYFNANTSADVNNMPPTMTGDSQYEIPSYYYSEEDNAVHNGVPTRFKYTFLGWAESKSASTPDYVPGNIIHLSQNTTLYAVWEFGIKSEQTLTTNGGRTITTSFPGQEQWIKIRLEDGASYWSKSGTSQIWSAAEGDPIGELYDASGNWLEWNDNSSLGKDDKNFRIPFTFSKNTTYYLSVTTDYFSSYYDVHTEAFMPETVSVYLDKVQNRSYAVFYDTNTSDGSSSLWRKIAIFDDYYGFVPSYGIDEKYSMPSENFFGWYANSGDILYPGDPLEPKSQTLTTGFEELREFPNGIVCCTMGMLSFGRQILWFTFTPTVSGTYHILLEEGYYSLTCSVWDDGKQLIDYDSSYDPNTGLNDYSVYLRYGKTYYIGVRPMVYFEGVVDMGYTFEICRAAKLSYDANGGSGAPTAQTGSYEYTIPSKEPERSGYVFEGWSTTPNNEDNYCYQPGDLVEVNAAVTLYAQWSRIVEPPYWGDVNGDNKINIRDITLISKHIAGTETLTKEQLCFGDVNLDGKTNISDITAIAQYIAGSISAFPCESAAEITVVPAKTQYTKGEALQTSGTKILVKNRNTSVSYELTDNISISGYNPNTVGPQTLTATFRGLKLTFTVTVKDKTYTLSYDAAGGTGAPDPQTGSTSYTIPMVIPTYVMYNFRAWYTINSSGEYTYYYPGDTITISSNTVLRADWRQNIYGGTRGSLDTQIKYPGQTLYFFYDPSDSGKYVFYTYGDEDTEGYLYDSSGKELAKNDNGGSGTNFRITYNLVSGTRYSIGVKYHSNTKTGNIHGYYGPVFTVSYNANGGSGAPSSQEKDFMNNIILTSSTPSTAKSYTITYNANGGSVSPSSKTVSCTFSKWNTKADGTGTSYNPGDNYTTDANVTLYAQWTAPAAGTLATPTKTGYTFDGWYTASGGGTKITSSTTITENKTLYAHWAPNTYTVRFNGNGATSGSMSNQSFTYDVSQNLTANAFKRAYTVTYNYNGATGGNSKSTDTATAAFNGWATSASGSKVYNDKQSVKNLAASGTVDLYANWTLGTVTLPTPTRSGYTFDGWYTNSALTNSAGAAGAFYKPTANTTLYAKWTQNPTYTVTLDPTGGSVSPTNMPVPATLPTPTKSFTIIYNVNASDATVSPTTKSVSCTFRNWNTSSSGSGTSYNAGAIYNLSNNVTLYAQWTNPTAGTLAIPTRTGYTFDGWYTASSGGNKITSSSTISANTTLYAHWTPNPVYSVTLNPTGGFVSPTSMAVPATLPTPTKSFTIIFDANGGSVSTSTRTVDCAFRYWNTSSSGSGTSYSSGATYTANSNTTLYAQWTNPTAGSLPTPNLSGYTFDGWFTSAYGGSRITSGSTISANTTLYAHWTLIPVTAVGCEILSKPNKTSYIYKESTDTSGIVLNIRYSDGSTKAVNDTSKMTFSGLNTSSVGTKTVSVTCEGVSTTFDITVKYAWWQNIIRIFLLGFLWY